MSKGSRKGISSGSLRFTSEHLLQQAVARLLTRMPNISDVQILQGSQEYGKDVVFQFAGPLGELLPCACVIKNGKISGKVSENVSARTVFLQIEQALDTPFINGGGEETRIHRVYVISPEEISQSTMQSIQGKLMSRSGQVVFLGGTKLFSLFQLYWLDFFADEHASIESHLAALARKAANKPLFFTAELYKLGTVSESEASIYVNRFLSRDVRIFKLKSIQHMVLDLWKSEWTRPALDAFLQILDSLAKLVNHLYNWSFLADDSPSSAVGEIKRFSVELEERWLAAAQAETGKLLYSEILGNIRVNIPQQSKLADDLACILDLLESKLDPLRDACSVSGMLPMDLHDISIFSNPNWKATSMVDDFARYSPIDVLHATSGMQIQVDESDVLSSEGPILIVGAAGFGKTSFCRWQALADAGRFRAAGSGILPVYLPLNTVDVSQVETFEEAFLKGVGRSALVSDSHLQQAREIRLYLDGLDEVSSETHREAIVKLILKGPATQEPKIKIIITSRDYIVSRSLAEIPRIELGPFTNDQIENLKYQWFKGAPHDRSSFDRQIERAKVLQSLMKVPLLATLMIMVFRQTGRLPESRARLYTIFLDLLSGGWDLAKGVLRPSQFGQFTKLLVLAKLAATAHMKRVRNFRASLAFEATERVMRCDSEMQEKMLAELAMDGILNRSGETYFFAHLSFQEFLTAKYFLGDPQSVDVGRCLQKFINGDDWWVEVLRFYIGLSESPSSMVVWLLRHAHDYESFAKIADLLSFVAEFFPDFDLARYVFDNAPSHLLNFLPEKTEQGVSLFFAAAAASRPW